MRACRSLRCQRARDSSTIKRPRRCPRATLSRWNSRVRPMLLLAISCDRSWLGVRWAPYRCPPQLRPNPDHPTPNPNPTPRLPAGRPAAGIPPAANALNRPYHNCCNYKRNVSDPTSGNTSCPCAACKGSCGTEPCYGSTSVNIGNNTGLGNPTFGVLNGANAALIGGVYGGVAVLSAAYVGVLWWGRRPQPSRGASQYRVLGERLM